MPRNPLHPVVDFEYQAASTLSEGHGSCLPRHLRAPGIAAGTDAVSIDVTVYPVKRNRYPLL
jgi:hypothetical protein